MMNIKEYGLSAALGLITGLVGVYVMGNLAAIAIPEPVFEWLKVNLSVAIGMVVLDIVFQFLAFGILGILSGWLIGGLKNTDWRINTLVYYFFYLFYLTIGVALLYKAQIQAPASLTYLKQTLGLPLLILPLCVVLAGYFSAKRTTVMQ